MFTENIVSVKPVNVSGKDMNIVTSASGKTIWATKEQMTANAETITYVERKAGEKYVDKKGVEGVLKSDRNDLVGFGKRDKFAFIESLLAKGLSPQLAL